MEDVSIIALYNERNESAITECSRKYGNYCHSIAYRILKSQEDAEECVLDTWVKAWNRIPPDQPDSLAAYLGTITRNLSFDRRRNQNTKKRGGNEIDLVLDELEAVLADPTLPDRTCEQKELSELINRFLARLPERDRNILLCRYYFVYPVKDIAKNNKMTPTHVRKVLERTLTKLKQFLEKENYL